MNRLQPSRPPHRAGFASLPMVTSMALMLMLGLLMVMRKTAMNQDQAAQAQLRVDYRQREEALLRALVSTFPQKAIDCMRAGYEPSDAYSWRAVFDQAVQRASASEALPREVLAKFAGADHRNANVGDAEQSEVGTWITSLTGEFNVVTPGTTAYASVFSQSSINGRVPPLLQASAELQQADRVRPVVSVAKRYSNQAAGLLADVNSYPLYNLIPYPNIRFGYAEPGQPFVAKRNWWAFSVTYGGGVRALRKSYLLSLYEIPSQLPIEAAAFAEIGRHQDGTVWDAATIHIDGSVYADELAMDGAFGASRVAGRRSIEITNTLDLQGTEVDNRFDELGVREALQAEQGTDLLPIALSANSGRLAFLPIQSGAQFLQREPENATLDDWQLYTAGGQKCKVTVEALSMVSFEDQTPTSIRVRYDLTAGGRGETVLTRGVNWPSQLEAGGDEIPFQTELTNNNRSCLTFQPGLLNAWLNAVGGAAVSTNNSIYFNVDPSLDPITVHAISDPPAPDDMCVIIRKGKDLTAFTNGISFVAPLRVYVGDDLNAVPASGPPSGSGLPAGAEFFPPMSIFASELRIGTTGFNRPFEHHGQLSTLASGASEKWQPLDVKSGSDDAVHADSISADLVPLRSPAELPPVHQMNWLVVVEEIAQE